MCDVSVYGRSLLNVWFCAGLRSVSPAQTGGAHFSASRWINSGCRLVWTTAAFLQALSVSRSSVLRSSVCLLRRSTALSLTFWPLGCVFMSLQAHFCHLVEGEFKVIGVVHTEWVFFFSPMRYFHIVFQCKHAIDKHVWLLHLRFVFWIVMHVSTVFLRCSVKLTLSCMSFKYSSWPS